MLKQCAIEFKAKKFNRQLRPIVFDGGDVRNVSIHATNLEDGSSSSLFVNLNGLYKLSINDSLRHAIYFDNELKEDLKVLLANGNQCEVELVLRLGNS